MKIRNFHTFPILLTQIRLMINFVLNLNVKETMLNKIRYALYRFMSGRYGNDELGFTLLGISVLLSVSSGFFGEQALLIRFISYVPLLIEFYRLFSRRIGKRRQENQWFLNLIKPLRRNFKVFLLNIKDKNSRYYTCPKCSQMVRVPKGRGHIEINCPHCHTSFSKKS